MATWKIALKHNLAGKKIPVRLKYEGNSGFEPVYCLVSDKEETFMLTGWDADFLDASRIKFVTNEVSAGNITYSLKSLNIPPFEDEA